jgi:hypothetical protein
MVLNVCCTDWVWLATVCPSISSTTLGAGLPPSALHDTVRSCSSVPDNLLGGITSSKLTLDGDTVVKKNQTKIHFCGLFFSILKNTKGNNAIYQ